MNNEKDHRMQKSLRSVEIFAGAAGLGLGLAKAGFSHEIIVENDSDACNTIRLNQHQNHPLVEGWRILEANIEDCDLSGVKGEVDLVAGGPPCQGFSIGGQHKGSEDQRNLWPWAIKTVSEIKPRAFVFENVPNMASTHKDYLEYLVKALTIPTIADPQQWIEDGEKLQKILSEGQSFDPSYDVSVDLLTSSDFGTGQKRKRLFITGIRKDVGAKYNTPVSTHSEAELLDSKWIRGEYWERHGLSRPVPNDAAMKWIRKHNQQPRDLFATPMKPWNTVRDIIANIPEWANGQEDAPRQAKAYKGHTGSEIDSPAKTHRAGVHGVSGGEMMIDFGEGQACQYRHFTTREAAALSDFPHDYDFSGTWSDCLRQIGNSVPCKMAQAVGQSIQKALVQ